MKFVVSILLIALLSFALCLFLPWWTIAIAAFLVSVIFQQSPFKSFLSGFLALFLLWGGLAWYISVHNNNLLAHRMSLLVLKTDSPFLLILLTACLGALIGAFASLAGSFLRSGK